MLLLVSLTRTNVLLGAIQSSKGLENKAFVPTPSRSPRLNRPANVVTRNVDELNDLSYQQLKQIKKKLRKWCEGTCEFQMFDPSNQEQLLDNEEVARTRIWTRLLNGFTEIRVVIAMEEHSKITMQVRLTR
jgi:hypothetical protein